jgi:two-component system response regulator NreC
MQPISVLLVDDHPVVRRGLRRLLDADPDIEVVGEAGESQAAIDLAERLRPRVVVMDIQLPGVGGLQATREILTRNADTSVLILTMCADDILIRQSLKAGARCYLLKDVAEEELVHAVKVLGGGRSYLSPSVSKTLLHGFATDGRAIEDNLQVLSKREREVLKLVAEGKRNKEIGAILGIAANTVETHRHSMMGKLDLRSVADVVRFAVRKKVVDVD